MIFFSLVGIGNGELADGLVKRVGGTEITANRNGITRTGMGTCQAEASEREIGGDALGIKQRYVERALHIFELTPVEIDVLVVMPTQKDIG